MWYARDSEKWCKPFFMLYAGCPIVCNCKCCHIWLLLSVCVCALLHYFFHAQQIKSIKCPKRKIYALKVLKSSYCPTVPARDGGGVEERVGAWDKQSHRRIPNFLCRLYTAPTWCSSGCHLIWLLFPLAPIALAKRIPDGIGNEMEEQEEKTENKRNGQLFGLHTNFALAGIQIEFGFSTEAGGGDGDGDEDGGGDEEGSRQQEEGSWKQARKESGVVMKSPPLVVSPPLQPPLHILHFLLSCWKWATYWAAPEGQFPYLSWPDTCRTVVAFIRTSIHSFIHPASQPTIYLFVHSLIHCLPRSFIRFDCIHTYKISFIFNRLAGGV